MSFLKETHKLPGGGSGYPDSDDSDNEFSRYESKNKNAKKAGVSKSFDSKTFSDHNEGDFIARIMAQARRELGGDSVTNRGRIVHMPDVNAQLNTLRMSNQALDEDNITDTRVTSKIITVDEDDDMNQLRDHEISSTGIHIDLKESNKLSIEFKRGLLDSDSKKTDQAQAAVESKSRNTKNSETKRGLLDSDSKKADQKQAIFSSEEAEMEKMRRTQEELDLQYARSLQYELDCEVKQERYGGYSALPGDEETIGIIDADGKVTFYPRKQVLGARRCPGCHNCCPKMPGGRVPDSGAGRFGRPGQAPTGRSDKASIPASLGGAGRFGRPGVAPTSASAPENPPTENPPSTKTEKPGGAHTTTPTSTSKAKPSTTQEPQAPRVTERAPTLPDHRGRGRGRGGRMGMGLTSGTGRAQLPAGGAGRFGRPGVPPSPGAAERAREDARLTDAMRYFVIPPRRTMDRTGILDEESRLRPAFTEEEWRHLQDNPLSLLDIITSDEEARRRTIDFGPEDYEALLALAEVLGEVKKKGLNADEIERIPVQRFHDHEYGADDAESGVVCGICWEKFSSEDELRQLQCEHMFHRDCLDTWIMDKAECPICRANLKDEIR